MISVSIRDELLAQHEAIRAKLDASSVVVQRWTDGAETRGRVRDELAALTDALRNHNLREEAAMRALLRARDDGSGPLEIVRICHVREHQDLFESIFAVTETDDPRNGALIFNQLRTRLLEHMKAEERSLLDSSSTRNLEDAGPPRQTLAHDRPAGLGSVAARVRLEHHVIRRLLDELEQASASARSGGPDGLERLQMVVWDLYLAFQDHLMFEERNLAPFLQSLADDLVRKMILEHNNERGVLLTLVEDSESDALGTEALTAQADDLVARFRSDMIHEDGVLSRLVQESVQNH
jgi:hypothetical protein